MAFPLTLLYVAIAMLSPGAFPPEISNLRIQVVVGAATFLACIFELQGSGLFRRLETYFLMGLVVAAVLSVMLTGWFGGAYEFLSYFFPTVAPFFFIVMSCRSLNRLKVLVAVMTLVTFYIVYQGAHAQFTGDLDSQYVLCEFCSSDSMAPILRSRGLGVLNDPNDLGQLLVCLLPLLWLRWKKGAAGGNLLFTLLPAAVLAWGIYLTHSRGGTIALAAVLLFGFKDKLSLVGSVLLSGLGGAAAVAVGATGGRGLSEDDGGRVGLWYDAMQAFKAHFLFGVGAGQFGDYNNSQTAHNSYILCLAETGLFGYFFWSGLLVTCWEGLTRRVKEWRIRMMGAKPERPQDKAVPWLQPKAEPSPVEASEEKAAPVTAASRGFAQGMLSAARELVSAPAPLVQGSAWPVRAESDEDVAYFARMFRISMVGFLAAAFFLSRTYSMTLYILIGMATVLRGLGKPLPPLPASKLLRQIGIAIFVSILVLYVAIRKAG